MLEQKERKPYVCVTILRLWDDQIDYKQMVKCKEEVSARQNGIVALVSLLLACFLRKCR